MYIEEDDKTVLDIIGDKTMMEFYQFLMDKLSNLKQYGPGIEAHKFTAVVAQTCMAMYDFAAETISGD